MAAVTGGTNEERSRSGRLLAARGRAAGSASGRGFHAGPGVQGRREAQLRGAARVRWRTRLPGSRGLWEHPRAAAPRPHGWRLPRTRFPSCGEGGGSRSPRALAPPPLLRAPKGRGPGRPWPGGKKHCALPGRGEGGVQTAPARLRSPAGGRCGGRSRGSARFRCGAGTGAPWPEAP